MKKIKYIYGLLLTVVSLSVSSCGEYEFVEPDFKTKSFGVYSDLFMYRWALNKSTINNPLSILDLSQGTLSRKWSFMAEAETDTDLKSGKWVEAKESIRFFDPAKGNPPVMITHEDGTVDSVDYTHYLKVNAPCVNNNTTNVFMYTRPGRYKVNIYNTYDSPIEYSYSEGTTDDVTTNYIHYCNAEKVSEKEYAVEFDFELLVYSALLGKAEIYTDSSYTTPLDIENAEKEKVENGDEAILVTKGETLYFLEAGGNTPYDGSSECTWGSTYKYGDAIGDIVLPAPTIVSESKPALDYHQSKAAITFDKEGTYAITMVQNRDPHKAEYNTGEITTKNSESVVDYLFKVVE